MIRTQFCQKASRLLLAALSASAVSSQALADDLSNIFSVSGFGTLGFVHSSLHSADYSSSSIQPDGSGATRRFDVANNSRFGIQLGARVTDKLLATVQVIAENGSDNHFGPHLEWANVKYAFTPEFSVRVGRIDLPTFMNSEYRNVGYAFPWTRLPVELYNTQPVTSSDGADVSYRSAFLGASNTIRMAYGHTSFRIYPGSLRFEGKNIVDVDDTIEAGNFVVHAGFLHATVDIESYLAHQAGNVFTLGASYDPGAWFVQGEIARTTVAEVTPGYLSGYIAAGVRFAKLTTFITYSHSQSLDKPISIANYDTGQRDLGVGVRWDVMKDVDLKVQFDHVWVPSNSTGSFINYQPGYQTGSGSNIVSATLDFVF
jgi:hypothetical protein